MSTEPSATPTSAAINPSQIDLITHITVPLNIKLTDSNFLSWKNQIQLIVEGHDLDSYLHNSPPDPTMRNPTGDTILNPNFLVWKRQDKLLNAWIRSSLSESILAQVLTSPTCKDLWQALEGYFAINSRAKLQDLKRQLQSISKGEANCNDYLNRIRKIADELSFIGNSVPEEDLVNAAINGLGPEFSAIKAALCTVRYHSHFTFSDLRGLLLSHESDLSSVSDNAPAAFLTGKNHTSNKTSYPP